MFVGNLDSRLIESKWSFCLGAEVEGKTVGESFEQAGHAWILPLGEKI